MKRSHSLYQVMFFILPLRLFLTPVVLKHNKSYKRFGGTSIEPINSHASL